KSKIFVFHFFSINYGLRSNFLLRFSLIKNLKVIDQKYFWLPAYSLHEFNLDDFWKDNDGETVCVESFHPLLPKNHGGDDGHMRFWGNYYNTDKDMMATVHSFPIDKKTKYLKKARWSRSMASKINDEKTYHYCRSYKQLKSNDDNLTHIGFNVILDNKKNPLSVWHNGGEYTKTSVTGSPKKMMQGFWCPDTQKIDPLIFLDEYETKINRNKINFFLINDKKIIESKSYEVEGSFQKKISEIFNNITTPNYFIMCDFLSKRGAYLLVSFNTKGNKSGDNVHAWTCNWRKENNQLIPIENDFLNTARKFFHFKNNLNNQDLKFFIVLHQNKKKNYLNKQIKFRILLDNKKEFLKSIDIDLDFPMKVIDLNKLFDFKEFGNFDSGIVQLESLYDNLNSTFYYYHTKSGHLATDHFTGG
ncbi:hypothetical protein OAB59_03665, partial [Pelagibacteraceae bacterium]|nr:hypothetical protein [Pelagibacteraceae bacterium]